MKQKMVIKLSWMTNQKSRNKALQITAGFRGVESAAIAGNDKDQIELIGDGADPVKLVNLLRKKYARPFCWLKPKMGSAVLVSVNPVDDKKEQEKKEQKKKEQEKKEQEKNKKEPAVPLPWQYGGWTTPHCVVYDPYPSSCSIL